MGGLTLTVVTPEREVLRVDGIDTVVAPGTDGELGVLPRHAPLVTQLQAGTLRYRSGGGEDFLTIFGGFLQVMGDTVTVLADGSERSEEIDLARAERARGDAQRELETAQVSGDEATVIRARLSLLRAMARIRTAQRAGRG